MATTQLVTIVQKLNGSLEWKTDKDLLTVNFFASGKKISDDKVEGKLEALGIDVTVRKLRELIIENARNSQLIEEHNDPGEVVFLNLPPRESVDDCDITEWDEMIWKDVKFIDNDTSMFYVKDSENANTYSAYLTGISTSDTSDAKLLREAYYQHITNKPEQIVKTLIKDFKVDESFISTLMYTLPVSAWDYIKIKAVKRDKDITWQKLIVPAGSAIKLYEGFIKLEGDFRSKSSHRLNGIKNLTNDPNEAAIAFIDLDKLHKDYKNKCSDLWDNFLLERFHNADYVSIFKSWVYAVAVGKNNSRQEMWLYGNGGTGKSVMCKAIINGLNKLAGKDICLAASKDTGKSNFNSELLNKHLMVYSDAKNLKSGMSEAKHNITGGDYMRIEGKGKEAISAKVYMKCLSCSNELPKVDMTDRSQSSRFIILPFTLDDNEMKAKGLMRADGSIIGSATFEDELTAEFPQFLASCKEHYLKRCETNSNIDAHEAKEYLESITLQENDDAEMFINDFFEITDNNKDRLTVKEFKMQFLVGKEWSNDAGAKPYSSITLDCINTYLEKKYGFRKANIHPNGNQSVSAKGLTSNSFGIKIKNIEEDVTMPTVNCDDLNF